MEIRVRFNRNILGHRAGQVGMVKVNRLIDRLVERGDLVWLDQPVTDPWQEEDPVEVERWLADETDTDEIELPTGETIPIEELMDRLAFEDDGGPSGRD